MLIGAIVALLVAAVGAGWMWLALATDQPLAHRLGAAALVLLGLTLGVRCGSHLLATLPHGAGGEGGELHDASDMRLPRLRENRGAVAHDARGDTCPWCSAPLRPRANRCPACGQAL